MLLFVEPRLDKRPGGTSSHKADLCVCFRLGSTVRHAELASGHLSTVSVSVAHDFLAKLSSSSLHRLTAFLAGLHTLLLEVGPYAATPAWVSTEPPSGVGSPPRSAQLTSTSAAASFAPS
jgi:hypothetical protein